MEEVTGYNNSKFKFYWLWAGLIFLALFLVFDSLLFLRLFNFRIADVTYFSLEYIILSIVIFIIGSIYGLLFKRYKLEKESLEWKSEQTRTGFFILGFFISFIILIVVAAIGVFLVLMA